MANTCERAIHIVNDNKPKVLEGQKFSEQCASIEGPFQQQAWKNAIVMKTEAANMR